MDEKSIKTKVRRRFSRMLIPKRNYENKQIYLKESTIKTGNSISLIMLIILVSCFLLAIFIIAFAVTRYCTYKNRHKRKSKDFCQNLESLSFDNCVQSATIKLNSQITNENNNETSRIIKNSYSWPETKNIRYHDEQEEKFECSSTISSLSNSSTNEPGFLTFSLRWNQSSDSLFVRVINARDLSIQRRQRQSNLIDSYVRIELLSSEDNVDQKPFQTMRTHIVKKNLNPIYDEIFQFTNIQQIIHENNQKDLCLLFTVLTYDTFTRDEILGQVTFPLIISNVLESNETPFTREITPRHKQLFNQQLGQILISICYQPIHSSITLIVLKASNLPRIDKTKIINPYFKIYMFYKGQRLIKKRSSIKRTTQSPVYNECFTFSIPNNDVENIDFNLTIFDYDHHIKHEPIGSITIGKSFDQTNQHWIDVCQKQISKQIAQWYQLKPFHHSNNI